MRQVNSVLFLTNDEALWQHWSHQNSVTYLPARGRGMEDLLRWKQQHRELVVMDSALALWNHPQWVQAVKGMKVVVASPRPVDSEGQAVLALGARAYIHAYSSSALLEQVLEHVASGQVWVGESLLSRLLSDVTRHLEIRTGWESNLTSREIEVAQRASLGHSNQLIAQDLGITERTVRAHLQAIFEKLGVTDRLMLALKVHGIS
ncbi:MULTISPECIES: response regulator transcription factor [Alcaligenes]|uniref:Response regulator transcription factor n=1 Tax=Alcaligenes aquatilis TaxID=323284 RepID=A0ABY4NG51_9BURK|nr:MULTISPECIES: response regulator transcription factor [Alcaligenes]AWG36124.1 helix-turn-helix transcriptional regulator [Alcaligenes aquatilis]MCC9165207.1 response regulator transcription factor [Alcaligenes sp. MMA]UQN35967.1 response regulator transcription factor [Alcaligenes aquatilis]UYY87242.1 response regulator transcription factor [Alcaligenes sp. SMD-FA]HBQ89628.1 helix-turn-helix transcriptional regulator [Alcaligenes faecalis]